MVAESPERRHLRKARITSWLRLSAERRRCGESDLRIHHSQRKLAVVANVFYLADAPGDFGWREPKTTP
jgi:hypothetical protein